MRRNTIFRTSIQTRNTTTGGISKEFLKYVEKLEELVKRIQSLDGKHILYAHSVTGALGGGSQSMVVDSAMIDRAVTPALHIVPPAFRDYIMAGGMLPEKKKAMIANFQRERALHDQKQRQPRGPVITSRKQFEAIYFNQDLDIYTDSKMGRYLNKSTQRALKR